MSRYTVHYKCLCAYVIRPSNTCWYSHLTSYANVTVHISCYSPSQTHADIHLTSYTNVDYIIHCINCTPGSATARASSIFTFFYLTYTDLLVGS